MRNEQHDYLRFNRTTQFGAAYGHAISRLPPKQRHSKPLLWLSLFLFIATLAMAFWRF